MGSNIPPSVWLPFCACPPCREEGTRGQEVYNSYITGTFFFFALWEVGLLCLLPCCPASHAMARHVGSQ